MSNLTQFAKYKVAKTRFACLSLYDATFASLAVQAGVKLLLVGDSLGMLIHNYPSTIRVSMRQMVYHTQAVAAGAGDCPIMADMPFASYPDPSTAVANAARLMRGGAHIVKLEGGDWLAPAIRALGHNGIPCCAHLGLTPQFVHLFGGYKVQGNQPEQAEKIFEASVKLCEAGANMLLLECVPLSLARLISEQVTVPVIGIGAGWDTDAQVLVVYDLLGLQARPPRFVRNFLADSGSIQQALRDYVTAVENLDFPTREHSYGTTD